MKNLILLAVALCSLVGCEKAESPAAKDKWDPAKVHTDRW